MQENVSAPTRSPFEIIKQTPNTISLCGQAEGLSLSCWSREGLSLVDLGGFGEGSLSSHRSTSSPSNGPALGHWVSQDAVKSDGDR